ncbi:HAD hydrolase-like protein [Nostoc linckia]|uniref:HAD hydrolase-like protein n=1 Tax=Nostoc linckia TaxID=92942 RepID=UPI000BFFBA2F|nr:HAD hydrolase-like protein [Nostoc linckia]
MVKILFLDIDGTATETLSGHTFKQHPQDVKVMEGADKAVSHFHNQGWTIIGISNQGGCAAINPDTGKPRKSIEDTITEMQFTLQLFPKINCIYFCPDFDGNLIYRVFYQSYTASERHLYLDPSTNKPFYQSFRKPGAGMLQKAAHDLELSLENSWMVGDRPEDEQCAINAGINFCPADVWRDRFRPGMFAHQVTSKQLRFLEGIEYGRP